MGQDSLGSQMSNKDSLMCFFLVYGEAHWLQSEYSFFVSSIICVGFDPSFLV